VPTTGPNYPSTGASLANSGTSENANAWVDPTNVTAASGVATIVAPTFDSGDISEILVASDFGFNVTGTVLGVLVEISKRGYTTANSGIDYRVQLATGTAYANLVGNNKASASVWPADTLATTTYGGSADAWGASLTAAQVNATGFAVFLSAYANVNNADIAVDWIRVTVTTSAATSANAVTATGTGATAADTAKVAAGGTGAGTATGAAQAAVGRPGIRALPGYAAATAAAAAITAKVKGVLAAATGTGAAAGAAPSLAVRPGAGTGTGAALEATAETAVPAITFTCDAAATATAAAVIAHGNISTSSGFATARSA